VLITGGDGSIGRCLRDGLAGEFDLRWTDRADADLADAAAVDRVVAGADAVVHLGAVADEASFDALAGPNLHGAFHVFEAARRHGVRRVVYASSGRITGMEPTGRRLAGGEAPHPDGLYAATKAWGEALGRMYADRFGLSVIALRIGTFEREPPDARALSTWLSHDDAVRLFRAALTAPDVGWACVYGVSANTRGWFDLAPARALGYAPQDDAERFADRFPEPYSHPLMSGELADPDYGGWAV
jgi:uronate dehydrogenase